MSVKEYVRRGCSGCLPQRLPPPRPPPPSSFSCVPLSVSPSLPASLYFCFSSTRLLSPFSSSLSLTLYSPPPPPPPRPRLSHSGLRVHRRSLLLSLLLSNTSPPFSPLLSRRPLPPAPSPAARRTGSKARPPLSPPPSPPLHFSPLSPNPLLSAAAPILPCLCTAPAASTYPRTPSPPSLSPSLSLSLSLARSSGRRACRLAAPEPAVTSAELGRVWRRSVAQRPPPARRMSLSPSCPSCSRTSSPGMTRRGERRLHTSQIHATLRACGAA